MEKQEKNKRKFLLLLPVLVLPFLALGFYALGGGRNADAGKAAVSAGLNTQLPGAQLKGQKQGDKLALYEQAMRDSARVRSASGGNVLAAMGWDGGGSKQAASSANAAEAKITEKLAEINRQVQLPPVKGSAPGYGAGSGPGYGTAYGSSGTSPDMDKLEKLLKQKSQASAPDPELSLLNGMLEKIMEIQHPERVSSTLKQQEKPAPDSLFKAFRAVLVKSEKVKTGTSVELRLSDTVRLNGMVIPKGQSLFGLCEVVNQRVLLKVKNIRLGTSLLPVDLEVYDLDGMAGIRANDADTQDALRSGSANAVQSMELLSMDQGLATQAAGAGLEAAKTLFSKKVKRVKAKLKAGYPLLLRNNRPNGK